MPSPVKWVCEGIDAGFVLPNGVIRAAIVSHVCDESVGIVHLHVLCHPDDPQFTSPAQEGPIRIARESHYCGNDPKPGTWHYLHGRTPHWMGIEQGIMRPPDPNMRPDILAQQIAAQRQQAQPQVLKANVPPQCQLPPLARAAVNSSLVSKKICYGSMQADGTGTLDEIEYDVLVQLNQVGISSFPSFAMSVVWLPFPEDGTIPDAEWINAAAGMIEGFIKADKNVLLQGRAGVSRPGFLDIAVHMKMNGWSRDEAISMIRAAGRMPNPTPGLLQILAHYDHHLASRAQSQSLIAQAQQMPSPLKTTAPGAPRPIRRAFGQ